MKSIVFNQGIILTETTEIPVGQGYVEIAPEKVLVDGLENAIFLGLLWVRPNLILGSIGLGKVTDVGIGIDQSIIGKKVLIMPYSPSRGGIGTEVNGVLAERSVVPLDSVVVLPDDIDDRSLLLPFISLALQIKELTKGSPTLVIGSGLTAIIFKAITDGNVEFADDSISLKNQFSKRWDYVVVSTLSGWARHVAEKILTEDGKVFVPKFLNSWPPYIPNSGIPLYPKARKDWIDLLDSKEIENIIKNFIGRSDNVIASIPTPKPGIIADVKKTLK
ncbi:hypothetical protein [Metallosphaera hakonensis]|uniref:Alcohol dehydrogenase n=1 Tax=Metallosphaera hakonensis JCM 8857 = DSM 7519 TaxID=1293036 RepID=A0A2U9IUA6_9CREN|nr:hypothetical protein [Metallosphaera hakonensis]AWR99618.1 alcohol dehydrogenase [Metallosphaera hakonensis JCM 8857 = DSM 7519]